MGIEFGCSLSENANSARSDFSLMRAQSLGDSFSGMLLAPAKPWKFGAFARCSDRENRHVLLGTAGLFAPLSELC